MVVAPFDGAAGVTPKLATAGLVVWLDETRGTLGGCSAGIVVWGWDKEGGGRAGEAGRCCGAIARGFAANGLVIWKYLIGCLLFVVKFVEILNSKLNFTYRWLGYVRG